MKIITLLACILAATASFADTLKSKQAAQDLAASVMEKVAEGKVPEGFDVMEPYMIIPTAEFDVMKNQAALQAPMIEQRFGKTTGVELIKIEEAGDSLMLVLYIQKFEKHIMRWKFYFYRPNDVWILNTFNFDDTIQLMFDTK